MANSAVIQIMCPKLTCRRILAVPARARGKLVRCRGCGSTIRVPQSKQAAPASEGPVQAPSAEATGGGGGPGGSGGAGDTGGTGGAGSADAAAA